MLNDNRTFSERQTELRVTCDRLEIPVIVAIRVLSGQLTEADLISHSERETWRAQYEAELAARQVGGKSARELKHRQALEIMRAFKCSENIAFGILAGQFPAAVIDPQVRKQLMEERKRLQKAKAHQKTQEKKRERHQGRVNRLWNTCDRLEIPAVIAILVLSGRLQETRISSHPERGNWRTQYQEELAARQAGGKSAKDLKRRQAEQIATVAQVSLESAQGLLNGIFRFESLDARIQEFNGRQRKNWLNGATDILQKLGLPEAMIAEILPKKSAVNPDTSPADVAMWLWRKRFDPSGFAEPQDLIAAWNKHRVWTIGDLRRIEARVVERQDREINAGMRGEQVAFLCGPERIEDTLHKIFFLNHWAKSRDRLLYPDRQGLYRVKARLLQEAYQGGYIRAVAFVSSTAPFAPFQDSDVWIDSAVEGFLDILYDYLNGRGDWVEKKRCDQALQLFRQAMGREAEPQDIDKLKQDDFEGYIDRRLMELQVEAINTRQPISIEELDALFLSPGDIGALWSGDVPLEQRFEARDWGDMDESNLRSLDPEGLNLVGFRYESPNARYIFHLPLRVAERFVPAAEIERLRTGNERTREAGEYFGREITEAESLAYPIEDILTELGVGIDIVCPEGLKDKADYIAEKKARQRWYAYNRYYGEWDDDDDEDDDDEFDDFNAYEPGYNPIQPRQKHNPTLATSGVANSPVCPECRADVEPDARMAHWQESHVELQAVSFSRAAWLMGISRPEFEIMNIAPDFRNESNTRYWYIETLKAKKESIPAEKGRVKESGVGLQSMGRSPSPSTVTNPFLEDSEGEDETE